LKATIVLAQLKELEPTPQNLCTSVSPHLETLDPGLPAHVQEVQHMATANGLNILSVKGVWVWRHV